MKVNKARQTVGIGTDILAIDRFRESMKKYGQRFLDRLFTKKEQKHCLKYQDPAGRLAARFCAKEAVVKALGDGFGKHIGFLDIEIVNLPTGKPTVQLTEKVADHYGHPFFHLSLSHCHEYAVATVIAEK